MTLYRNEVFKKMVVEYLEYKDENELALIIKSCDLIFSATGQFTYRIWNQTSVELDIRVPLPLMKKIDEKWEVLTKICYEVYPDDEDHALMKIYKRIKIPEVIDEEQEDGTIIISTPNDQVFNNLIAKVHKDHIDSIEKDYIIEACYCAINGYRLAAATMIGCAAERLLSQLCDAYLAYLKNGNGTAAEIKKFDDEVVNSKKAHARLDGFLRKTRNSEEVFKSIGLENSNLHFSFLDIVRQVRNESGHPTGVKVSSEDLSSIFVNYQLLIERVHPVITELPKIKGEIQVI